MLETLDPTIMINIMDHLDCKSLLKLSRSSTRIRDDYKDYIYYRHCMENQTLNDLEYFLKNQFGKPIFASKALNNLFYYISTQESLVVAGGFPTQLYMNRIPKKTSDIDIYVLGGLKHKYTPNDYMFKRKNLIDVHNILEFIYSNYSNIRTLQVGSNVYTITVEEFTHPIQIILTTYCSPAEVLSSFDNSHNRCGIYKDDTYIGMDTMLSHSKKITYFYKPTKVSRYIKAMELGFHVFGISTDEADRMIQMVIDNPVNDQAITQRSTPEIIITNLIQYANPNNNWIIGYYYHKENTIQYFDKCVVDMTSPLSREVKMSIYNGKGVRNYPHLSTIIQPSIILKSPHSAFLKFKKPQINKYKYQIVGKLEYTTKGCKILVTDSKEIEKLKIVKQNMLELFRNYHKVNEVPDKIKKCRTFTTWSEFETYRDEVGVPINPNSFRSVFKIGFEYDDCLRIYEDCVYIKGFLDPPNDVSPETHLFEIETTPMLTEYTISENGDNDNRKYNPFSWGFYSNKIISHTI
jgi:hypothetical protein